MTSGKRGKGGKKREKLSSDLCMGTQPPPALMTELGGSAWYTLGGLSTLNSH